MSLGRAILFQLFRQNGRDIILKDQILLIHPFEQSPPQSVDRFALLVHHIVVLEQMFARFEVLPFHGLLRGLDAARNHPGFDGHALFHSQALEQFRDPLLGEDAHQVVFQRKVETRRPGITLASGAPAKLIVDAARLVAFRAENMQATNRSHFVVLDVGLSL